jgi:hypothetical protein
MPTTTAFAITAKTIDSVIFANCRASILELTLENDDPAVQNTVDLSLAAYGAFSGIHGVLSGGIHQISPAYLTGGNGATAVIGTWQAVTDGEFAITIDGTARNVTGINFSACAAMADVATAIQTAIRALTSSTETVVWSTNHFVITSADVTSKSAITVTSAVGGGAGTDISGVGATAFMDADTGHGTVTNNGLGYEPQVLISGTTLTVHCTYGDLDAVADGPKINVGTTWRDTQKMRVLVFGK